MPIIPGVTKELVPQNDSFIPAGASEVPATIAAAGPRAGLRFLEFFTANIRNPNTRRAYHRACSDFFLWTQSRHLELERIGPVHVAAYVEKLCKELSRPSVKQALAAIRMLYNYMVVGQAVPFNPATSVRGPKHVVKKGKTPVLSAGEARQLLDSIDTSSIVGLRDRALIALMIYTFARVGAATAMDIEDWYVQGGRWWVRLHEKGGKRHDMPAHHNLEQYMEAYLALAGKGHGKSTPLFRTAKGRTGRLTDHRMIQPEVYLMVRRRAAAAGIRTKIGNHTFRATGITTYLKNGGKLEVAQQMAAHESARTTGLYDRRGDEISLDAVEKIVI